MRRLFNRPSLRGRGDRVAAAWLLALGIALVANVATPRALHARINKEKAYIATMRADLRNMVTAQEAFFSDSARYAMSLEALGERYQFSSGVELVSLAASTEGFQAKVRHYGTTVACWISIGPPLDSALHGNEGESTCDEPGFRYASSLVPWAVAYVVLFLLVVGIRVARAEVPLPPIRAQTIFGFTLLATIHPFWPWLQDDSGSCLGMGDGPGVMAVIFISYIVARTALRGSEESDPPRPA